MVNITLTETEAKNLRDKLYEFTGEYPSREILRLRYIVDLALYSTINKTMIEELTFENVLTAVKDLPEFHAAFEPYIDFELGETPMPKPENAQEIPLACCRFTLIFDNATITHYVSHYKLTDNDSVELTEEPYLNQMIQKSDDFYKTLKSYLENKGIRI